MRTLAKIWAAGTLALGAVHAQTGGAIRGAVVDPAGAVIPNAHVTVQGNGITTPLLTDPEGRFVASGLPPGQFEIRVSALGFTDAAIRAVSVKAGAETSVGQILLKVDVPACDPGPKFTFEPIAAAAAEISGMVEVPLRGSGPAGVLVTLVDRRSQHRVHSALTDSSGAFGFTAVPPGTYRLTAHVDGYADFVVDPVEAKPGSATRLHWALVLRSCPAKGRCLATREFPPLVCL